MSVHTESAQRGLDFIRENHSDAYLCLGYLWSLLAGIAGGSYPKPPWDKPQDVPFLSCGCRLNGSSMCEFHEHHRMNESRVAP